MIRSCSGRAVNSVLQLRGSRRLLPAPVAAAAAAASLTTALANINNNAGGVGDNTIMIRSFASAAAAPKKKKASAATAAADTAPEGYLAQKKKAKDRRRELYNAKQDRKERLQTRRDGKQREGERRAFRSFFIKKKVDEEYMNRKARQAGLGWKTQVAVILERLNVVLPDREDWDVEYENMSTYLMQFGKMYPKGLYNVDYSAELAITDEELMELLPKGYTPAPRETEADATGNVRTTDRKLKTSVYLTVLEDGIWQMPTVDLDEASDELLLEAAKRAIPAKVGPQVEFWCPSNAPFAVDMVAFPEEDRTVHYGTKKFFVKVQYDEGSVSEGEMTVDDFAWLDRGEVADRVRNEQGDAKSKFYHYML